MQMPEGREGGEGRSTPGTAQEAAGDRPRLEGKAGWGFLLKRPAGLANFVPPLINNRKPGCLK